MVIVEESNIIGELVYKGKMCLWVMLNALMTFCVEMIIKELFTLVT